MGKLIVTDGSGMTQEYALDKERVTIGRHPDNDISLNDKAVSGHHAIIITILQDSFLEDLDSTNGTQVNTKQIAKHPLVNGDVISSLDFLPGNFNAEYGRAMGGTVDVRTREPKREFHGAAQFDLYDGTVLAEGPVGDGSVFVSARRGWIDQVLKVALRGSSNNTVARSSSGPAGKRYTP